jgi:ferrochelatase
MKTGILLFNLGGPERLEDVRPFLYNLFSDPEIIRVKFTPLRKAIALAIATLRRKKSEGYYVQIGGGSPLRRLTEQQAKALQDELRGRGQDVQTFVGMITWHPFFQEALQQVERAVLDRLVVLPLFPQFSVTTTGSGSKLLQSLIAQRPALKQLPVHWIKSWQDHPAYIAALAEFIRRELAKFAGPDKAHLLFSAHSIPQSYVKQGDPYLDQTKQTMEAIMDKLGRRNTYQLSFQSKIGPVKWLEPSTNDVIIDLGKRGIHDVLVIPISFVSEHIETLYELDILYKHVAEDAGVSNLRRVPALNSDPAFIKALAEIVESCPI